jgi:hypothetical protein
MKLKPGEKDVIITYLREKKENIARLALRLEKIQIKENPTLGPPTNTPRMRYSKRGHRYVRVKRALEMPLIESRLLDLLESM